MKELKFLTIEQVAAIGHCSVRHIHNEIKRGLLPYQKPGRKLVFNPDDVLKWIKRKTQVA